MENILEVQKKAFLKEGPPSLEKRIELKINLISSTLMCLEIFMGHNIKI